MWQVTHWIDEDNPSKPDCFILINTDSNGRELQRAGHFEQQSSADTIARYLNSVEVHAANVFANYMSIDYFLRRYIIEQEKVKVEESIRMAEEATKQWAEEKDW